MTCCKCNRTGRCQNCSCVKKGKPCQSCLLQRLGNCVNTVQTRSSSSAFTDMPLTQPPPSTLNSAPETPPTGTSATSPSNQPSSPIRSESNPVRSIPETPLNSGLSPRAPENVAVLPQFTPMADPVFTWGEYGVNMTQNTLLTLSMLHMLKPCTGS